MFADTLSLILFPILIISLLLQLYFSFFVHLKLAKSTLKATITKAKRPVSVIIYSRNQAKSLRSNLPVFLAQNYPDFEVIVIDDCSWDDTEDLLRDFASRYDQLKVVSVAVFDKFRKNKKFALSLGIKAAQHEHLIFSDADCLPVSNKWIKEIQAGFTGKADVVLGFARYEKTQGPFNMFIRYESFFSALNYLSFALKGISYGGSGRNMAYLKSLFFSGKGFASHMQLSFGHDDLFVNQHAGPENVAVVINPISQISVSNPVQLKLYFKEKLHQMLATFRFKTSDKLKLSTQALSAMLFYTALIGLMVLHFDWKIVLAIYLLRLFTQFAVYFKIFNRLGYPELKWWFPLLDFIYYIYVLALGITTLFKIRTS